MVGIVMLEFRVVGRLGQSAGEENYPRNDTNNHEQTFPDLS